MSIYLILLCVNMRYNEEASFICCFYLHSIRGFDRYMINIARNYFYTSSTVWLRQCLISSSNYHLEWKMESLAPRKMNGME